MTGYEQDCLREVAKWLNEKPSTPAPTEAIATLCAVVQVSEAYIATIGRDVERLRKVARNVYEVWAGSEGIPMPETVSEAYLLQLVEQMRDEAKNGL